MNTHLQLQLNHWLGRDPDPVSRAALEAMVAAGDEAALGAAFSGRLEFGTAGLRGVVGPGPMAMNRLVVRETSAGLGAYLASHVKDAHSRGVIIGFDGRHDSRTFAHDAASVLCAMGFKVHLTATVAPTPLVAYGVCHFHAAAGVVVTASHNPPQYNGYKVYWENGAQIIPPHDAGIAACIDRAANEAIPFMDQSEATKRGLLEWLQQDFFEGYRRAIKHSALLSHHTRPDSVAMAYSAMHGVGAEMALTLLKDAGFTAVYPVAAQQQPDGDFPTVKFPNPEEAGAMDLVIAEASARGAMLACANDPDADRFAVAVRRDDGSYRMLSGDQVGCLLGDYLLSLSPKPQLVGKTLVSSGLLEAIAGHYDGRCYTTLTGFKWLMNTAQKLQTPSCPFLFAYEEALGYTVGHLVWDKDGLSAQLAFAQLTAALASAGMTLWDRLEQIYRRHGFHHNCQVSIALGADTPNIGEALRAAPPSKIGGRKVNCCEDLKWLTKRYADGREETIHLPASDVLIYHLDGDEALPHSSARVIVRPSGTEPKIKCYYELVLPMAEGTSLAEVQRLAETTMDQLVTAHQASLPH
ncbi:phospho-sugar mutase [Shewanella cyperi]|uniref:Phospho-sugar mutase n=1 Tax=Shewanella cyperi TaxID=2814292 RepID=A0A974XMR8_9GAMM|nr:phospho-sugar mutase [Shewanella cyperi]QSX31199.1 phospho-sugar mutase [Shewanella cyperi]